MSSDLRPQIVRAASSEQADETVMSGQTNDGAHLTGNGGHKASTEITSLSSVDGPNKDIQYNNENDNNNNDNNDNDMDNDHEASPGSEYRSQQSLPRTSMTDLMSRVLCGYQIPENWQMLALVLVSRALPIIAAVGCVFFIIILLATPDNWKTNEDADDDEVLDRESNRGLLVSVLIAILLNIIGATMFYIKVKESLVVTNYGFILGPVIGYLLDQGIGTDAGFRKFGTISGVWYTFSSLIGGNFMRYIVTVFLDLFISNPLQDVLKNQVKKKGVMKYLKNERNDKGELKDERLLRYDRFVVLNYPSILQSIVAFVTFNAYTNQTRFAWAYASSTLDRDLRIPPGTIMLCSAIAGILYLNFYTIMDYISEREYFDVNTKLFYVLAILGLLYGLNATDTMEAPVDGEDDENYTAWLGDAKPFVGFLFFMMFVSYGFVYPFYTRLGCCGRWKPKTSNDHMMDDDTKDLGSVMEVKNKVSDEILDKLQAILKASQGIDISQARAQYEAEQKILRKKAKQRRG